MHEVPDDEKEAALYVQKLYQEKDKLMDNFLTHGDFFKNSDKTPLKPKLLKPRICECSFEILTSRRIKIIFTICIHFRCSSQFSMLECGYFNTYFILFDEVDAQWKIHCFCNCLRICDWTM